MEKITISIEEYNELKRKAELYDKTNGVAQKSNDHISEAFQEHLKIFFDLENRNVDAVVVSSIYKCYDAPYDLGFGFIHDENEEVYDALAAKYGEDYSVEWSKKFDQFVNAEIKGLTYEDGNDLHPGDKRSLVVWDDMTIDIENE